MPRRATSLVCQFVLLPGTIENGDIFARQDTMKVLELTTIYNKERFQLHVSPNLYHFISLLWNGENNPLAYFQNDSQSWLNVQKRLIFILEQKYNSLGAIFIDLMLKMLFCLGKWTHLRSFTTEIPIWSPLQLCLKCQHQFF